MARFASSLSSGIVAGPSVRICWSAPWYSKAASGTVGNWVFTTLMFWKCTVRAWRLTCVWAVIWTTPNTGFCAPGGRTETAACAARLNWSHESSCGWYIVYVAPAFTAVLGHGSGFAGPAGTDEAWPRDGRAGSNASTKAKAKATVRDL